MLTSDEAGVCVHLDLDFPERYKTKAKPTEHKVEMVQGRDGKRPHVASQK